MQIGKYNEYELLQIKLIQVVCSIISDNNQLKKTTDYVYKSSILKWYHITSITLQNTISNTEFVINKNKSDYIFLFRVN